MVALTLTCNGKDATGIANCGAEAINFLKVSDNGQVKYRIYICLSNIMTVFPSRITSSYCFTAGRACVWIILISRKSGNKI